MPRVKVPRKSTHIDMTAMCDVAALLLTFFILTATARQPEPLPVDTPSSTVQIKQPTTDIATITVGEGKVFFGVAGQTVRARLLELMGERYKVGFTPEEKERFSLIESFGVPIGNVKQLIAMGGADRMKPGAQPGIPVDSVGANASELYEWIRNARIATKEINNTAMRVSIKGDSEEEYPTIKKVIDILQAQEVNKFSLITSMEGRD
ncbi:biopolymer transporter ExbD [Pedobacter sp. SYSU D00535]|uniref:ExbD/TolR family protein n=1 Tax=Pedobacter sp. SYSU D00535 TaxID=2810308 RepID=UPI001A96ABF9|nr:biopolymer transporter ExbD [Pedobacter sp. SYSU D00535]